MRAVGRGVEEWSGERPSLSSMSQQSQGCAVAQKREIGSV